MNNRLSIIKWLVKRKWMTLFLSIALLSGCYVEGPDSYDEYDLVYTNYKKDHTFPGHKYYYVPDSVVIVTSVNTGGFDYIAGTYGDMLISSIRSNMAILGYEEVPDSSLADYIVFPLAAETENIAYYYDYYYYYWGYYPYYPYAISTTYTSGTFMMNIIDKNDKSANGKSPIVWVGIINGLLEGNTSGFQARLTKSINQAFAQSSYLHQ